MASPSSTSIPACVADEFKPHMTNPYTEVCGNNNTARCTPSGRFWVAINGHASDPRRRPAPRTHYSFAAAPLYEDANGYLFYVNGTLYRVPESEMIFVQEKGTSMTKTTKTTKPAAIEQPAIAGFPGAPEPKATKAPSKKAPKRPDKVCFAADELKGQEWITATITMQTKAVDAAKAMYGTEPAIAPTSLYKRLMAEKTGKPQGALNRDAEQLRDLGIIAHDLGWTNPEFVTEKNVTDLKGTVKEGAYRHMMWFKMGTVLRRYYVVNVNDVEWPNGTVPTEIPDKEPTPEPKPVKRTTKTKRTTTRRRTNAPKTKAPNFGAEYAALKAELDEQKAANAALAAQIAEMNNATAQTTAILAALAGKLGI